MLGLSVRDERVNTQGDDPIPEPSLPPPSLPHPAPPARIQLRERMPSQFPAELAGLPGEMREGYDRLEMLRKGHGLFQLMRDAEKEKVGLSACLRVCAYQYTCSTPTASLSLDKSKLSSELCHEAF